MVTLMVLHAFGSLPDDWIASTLRSAILPEARSYHTGEKEVSNPNSNKKFLCHFVSEGRCISNLPIKLFLGPLLPIDTAAIFQISGD